VIVYELLRLAGLAFQVTGSQFPVPNFQLNVTIFFCTLRIDRLLTGIT
jgi:hypothetical protein